MSFVLAVMTPGRCIIAGDTQLNDDNGPIKATGIKVLPINNHTAIGITGRYCEYLDAYNEVISQCTNEPSYGKIKELFSASLKEHCPQYNAVIVQCNTACNYFTLLSSGGTDEGIYVAADGTVKALLPPGITTEECQRIMTPSNDLKDSMISCIRGVSKISNTVNAKVFGLEFSPSELRSFTDGITYDQIDFRIRMKENRS